MWSVCRDRQALAKANRRLEKKMKELIMQGEDERRIADQYKEQVSVPVHMLNHFHSISSPNFYGACGQRPTM